MDEHITKYASEMYEFLMRGDYRKPVEIMNAICKVQHYGIALIGNNILSTYKDAAGNQHFRVDM